jgi:hypothetical protein
MANAVALPIPMIEPGWKGLDKETTRCKNFQFGVEYFGWRDGDSPLLTVHPDQEHSGDGRERF